MKRDEDYIRELLQEFEAQQDWLILIPPNLDMSPEERRREYHVLLLCDAGLLTAVGRGTFRLTSRGHDFVAAMRDEGIWSRTKAAVAETGGNATLRILEDLGKAFLRKQVADRTGIEL